MATLVGSQAASGIQPRQVHTGVNSVCSTYSLTATLSAGDIIQMCKLPDGARIVGVTLGTNINPGDACLFNVGVRGDHDQFIASATCSANVIFRGNVATGLGAVLDVSDDAATRYSMVEIKVSDATGTGTKSGAISLVVQYQLDQ